MTEWLAGSVQEVAWHVNANHVGGYGFRLCKLPDGGISKLTEECFQRTPLAFARDKQALLWNNGTRLPIRGVFVDQGTTPPGSTWVRAN